MLFGGESTWSDIFSAISLRSPFDPLEVVLGIPSELISPLVLKTEKLDVSVEFVSESQLNLMWLLKGSRLSLNLG